MKLIFALFSRFHSRRVFSSECIPLCIDFWWIHTNSAEWKRTKRRKQKNKRKYKNETTISHVYERRHIRSQKRKVIRLSFSLRKQFFFRHFFHYIFMLFDFAVDSVFSLRHSFFICWLPFGALCVCVYVTLLFYFYHLLWWQINTKKTENEREKKSQKLLLIV